MRKEDRRSSPAFVLVAVLIVISILSYSAYEFAHWIQIETEMAMVQGREAQARYMAESGLAYIESIERLRRQGKEVPALDNNADLFDQVAVALDEKDSAQGAGGSTTEPEGRMTIRSSMPSEGSAAKPGGGTAEEQEVRFGPESEGGRIHLNAWWVRDPAALQAALLALPGSSKELVESVLDWLDEDDEKREGGAEREEYEKLEPAIVPRNGLVESIDELLLVQGMTPAIFFGEDANRNGMLDPEENDGDASPPLDDEDGTLDAGWKDYLTIWSVEPNIDQRGVPRVWINDFDLGRLYGAVEKEFGIEWAQWIITARVVGMFEMDRDPASTELGPFHFRSVLDVIDARVVGVYEKQPIAKESPLRSTAGDFGDQLHRLMDRWTVEWEPAVAGRLDVTSARGESLELLRVLSEEDRKKILESRPAIGLPRESNSVSPGSDSSQPRGTNAWLLTGGILSRETLRSIDRMISSSSRVIRFEALGGVLGQRQGHRLEMVLDLGTIPPRVRSRSRMDRWGSINSVQQKDESSEVKELPTLGEESTTPSS